jgi:hypothetical protein
MSTRILISLALLLVANQAISQEKKDSSALTFSAYVDIYYLYDVNNPSSHNRPPFLYSYNRSQEFNLNLGLVRLGYATSRVRANLGLMAGTYAQANLAAEPELLRHVYEANVGVRLSSKSDLWLDAGVLPSHIGFESAIGKDCWNMTRSIGAENSPYYETGLKLTYTTPNTKWQFAGLLLNGWQRMRRPDGNSTPAFGTEIVYKANNRVTLNSSTFIGNDQPDSLRKMRYFHDFYAIMQMGAYWSMAAGLDAGMQQRSKGSSNMDTWIAPVIILRYAASQKLNVSARGEWYQDSHGVIVPLGVTAGQGGIWGASINADLDIREHVLWRTEIRLLSSKSDIFEKGGDATTNTNLCLGTGISVYF